MSSTASQTPSNPLPEPRTCITTHDDSGASVFAKQFSNNPLWKPIGPTSSTFADIHVTPSVPANLSTDLSASQSEIANNKQPARIQEGGVRFCVTNTPPGQVSPMHRTLSIDYGAIISGQMQLTLESGEKRLLRAGDTFVQRATMHQWRNPSETEWCRMICVMMPIEEGTSVAGKVLETEFRVPGGAPPAK
jgi:quercetin dioxygenase-like cupin family protein